MLQTKAITRAAYSILKQFMSMPVLDDFSLAGGTGLALQLGHRLSEDIDLFCEKDFNEELTFQEIKKSFNTEIILKEKNSLNLLINEVKVDILSYQYPLLQKIINVQQIRVYSIPDIAAMKLSAISSRGSKKDFYDLYFLLKKYTLYQLLNFYNKKFSTTQNYHVLKSLIYFEDAESDPDPQLLSDNIHWTEIKRTLEKAIENFIKSQKTRN